MTLNRKEIYLVLVLTALKILSTGVAATLNENVRILSVGVRGESKVTVADLLSGTQTVEHTDGNIVKASVITPEGRRMTLTTGPNLCEKSLSEQSFTSALFLSAPGPHAVLIHLNDEDQASEACDPLKQAQKLLGDEVLKFCIVLLNQNQLSGTSRKMIKACGGRFHIISNSIPKTVQGQALVAEIDKLVLLNGASFHSPLDKIQQLMFERQELLKNLQEINGKLGESHSLCTTSDTKGVIVWSLIISLLVVDLVTEITRVVVALEITFVGLVAFMTSIRNVLGIHVAFAINLALCSTVTAAFVKHLPPMHQLQNRKFDTEFLFTVGLGVTLGSVATIRTFFDVFLASFAAFGVSLGALVFLELSFDFKTLSGHELVLFFFFSAVGAELPLLVVIVINAVFGVGLTIVLIISVIAIAPKRLQFNAFVSEFLPPLVLLSCGCVLAGPIILIVEMLFGFLKGWIELVLGSFMFYLLLLIVCLLLMGKIRT